MGLMREQIPKTRPVFTYPEPAKNISHREVIKTFLNISSIEISCIPDGTDIIHYQICDDYGYGIITCYGPLNVIPNPNYDAEYQTYLAEKEYYEKLLKAWEDRQKQITEEQEKSVRERFFRICSLFNNNIYK